jgi:CRP-like cAMP-binding protein
MNIVANEIQKKFPFLDENSVTQLLSVSIIKNIEAGVILVKEGENNANVHLILKGLLRSYVITSAGEERTVLISKEKMRAVSANSLIKNEPSEITIESIEPSTILIINSQKFQELIKSQPKLASLEKEGMMYFLTDAMERLHFFTVLSPEERYISFKEKHPELIQRVPQKYLASYLGLTTVSLSRIKSRIVNKKK